MRAKILLVVLPMLIGCGAPYEFVRQTAPSPFTRPGCRAVLEPVHADQLRVGEKSEAEYMNDKSDKSADSYQNDKVKSIAIFGEMVMGENGLLFSAGGAPDNSFIIRPVWGHWSPGYYAVVSAAPGRAEFIVDVLTAAGQPLDRISFVAAGGGFATGQRMNMALRRAGQIVNRYIADNWMCAAH